MDISNNIITLFLVFSRIAGIFLLTPVFGNKNLPIKSKIGFTFFLTYIVSPLVLDLYDLNILNIYSFLFYIFSEFLIGLSFGFISQLVLNSIYVAGVIVDRNIGFSIVNVLSPQDESEMPITANFYYIFAMLIFLVTNSHHLLIKSIIYSFNKIPLGYSFMNLLFLDKIINLIQVSFILGFKIASPVVITILVANVLLGILSRAMPQMNVFIVGMPLKIFIGLITIYLIIPLYFNIFENIFITILENIKDFINMV